MLAKQLKIVTILKQRSYIENGIRKMLNGTKDGDPAFPYAGHVYQENLAYFGKEGFNWKVIEDGPLMEKSLGRPIYFFIPKDDESISLSEDEMKEAEKYQMPPMPNKEDIEKAAQRAAERFVSDIMRRSDNEEPYDPVDCLFEALFGVQPDYDEGDDEEDTDEPDDEDWGNHEPHEDTGDWTDAE